MASQLWNVISTSGRNLLWFADFLPDEVIQAGSSSCLRLPMTDFYKVLYINQIQNHTLLSFRRRMRRNLSQLEQISQSFLLLPKGIASREMTVPIICHCLIVPILKMGEHSKWQHWTIYAWHDTNKSKRFRRYRWFLIFLLLSSDFRLPTSVFRLPSFIQT